MKTAILTVLPHFFQSKLDEIYDITNRLNQKLFAKSSCGNVDCDSENIAKKFLPGAGKNSWTYNFFQTKKFPSKCSCGEMESNFQNPAQNFSTGARKKSTNL